MVTFPDDVPVLVDEALPTITLRAHRSDDVEDIAFASNDPAAQDFLNLPHPYTVEAASGFITMVAQRWEASEADYRSWAIEVNGTYAGNVSVKRKPAGAVEIGYLLHPRARGMGAATRAANLALDHAARAWDPSVFHWRASVGNWASRAVAWKLGFTVDCAYPSSGTNAYGEGVAEWLGHREVRAPKQPSHPWWVPIRLAQDGVVLTPHEDPVWAESMASGRGIIWDYRDADGGSPAGFLSLASSDGGVLKNDGALDFSADWAPDSSTDSALAALIKHSFATRDDDRGRSGLGLHRIVTSVDADDERRTGVLLRAGFTEWGRSSARNLKSGGLIHFELVQST